MPVVVSVLAAAQIVYGRCSVTTSTAERLTVAGVAKMLRDKNWERLRYWAFDRKPDVVVLLVTKQQTNEQKTQIDPAAVKRLSANRYQVAQV